MYSGAVSVFSGGSSRAAIFELPVNRANSSAPRNGQAAVTFAGEAAGVKVGDVLLVVGVLGDGLLDDDGGAGAGLSSGPVQAEAATSRPAAARIPQDLSISGI
ncbi:hypothetical protein GCM10027598_78830 [Amycolatopsis oliviviridis]|uniref:Uncharacterized protein n=1 Tax=Amycolatopsis oliviviridis TaxID=1471590 RepID=A0ABQ3L664_9PSEU|nr:hypothetical protein GCM10017790_08760 [Amycolatopsis oliviviridis]